MSAVDLAELDGVKNPDTSTLGSGSRRDPVPVSFT